MSVFELKTRVSYDDIGEDLCLTLRGAMGAMQEAAIIHSGQIGYSIDNVPYTGVIWMLLKWRVRMISKARWNDDIIVQTWPRTMHRISSERDFRILSTNGDVIAIGTSDWTLVNAETGRITRIDSKIAEAYDLTDEEVFEDSPAAIENQIGEEIYRSVVQRRDIDTNHHVNNRVYLDYAAQALPESISPSTFKEVNVRYRKQLFYGDAFVCKYFADDNKHQVNICDALTDQICATVVYL